MSYPGVCVAFIVTQFEVGEGYSGVYAYEVGDMLCAPHDNEEVLKQDNELYEPLALSSSSGVSVTSFVDKHTRSRASSA